MATVDKSEHDTFGKQIALTSLASHNHSVLNRHDRGYIFISIPLLVAIFGVQTNPFMLKGKLFEGEGNSSCVTGEESNGSGIGVLIIPPVTQNSAIFVHELCESEVLWGGEHGYSSNADVTIKVNSSRGHVVQEWRITDVHPCRVGCQELGEACVAAPATEALHVAEVIVPRMHDAERVDLYRVVDGDVEIQAHPVVELADEAGLEHEANEHPVHIAIGSTVVFAVLYLIFVGMLAHPDGV
jgi:hypothetical protein